MSVWRERKKKKITSSLSHITPFKNECILCAFAFPPPLLPLPPLLPSDASLLHLHLCRHPLPPCSKEWPRTTTGTGGGGAWSTATVICRHHHYLFHSLSGAAFGGALPWPQTMATMNACMPIHHNNRAAAVACGLCLSQYHYNNSTPPGDKHQIKTHRHHQHPSKGF